MLIWSEILSINISQSVLWSRIRKYNWSIEKAFTTPVYRRKNGWKNREKQETRIQDLVRLELSKKGCKVFRCNVGNFYTKYGQEIKIGTPGHSDLYGVKPGGKAFL